MANRDPAFLWETEALRTGAEPLPPPVPSRGGDWLTLRQASEATGIPVSTLRNWARKGRVPSTLVQTRDGPRRMVSLEAVRARASQLGLKNSRAETVADPAALASVEEQPAPPPGTMLVPIDAWDKMLIQLGNLHEAGQQLAEARERAARAETEAAFLRERLAEMRTGPTPEPGPARIEEESAPVDVEPEPVAPAKMPRFSAYLWRMAVSDRRRRA